MKKLKAWLKGMGAYRREFDERATTACEQLTSPDTDAGAAPDEQTYRIAAVSNDSSYTGGQLWGMYGDRTTPANAFGSQAGEAWAAGHVGSMKVAVGVIDSGLDYTHADLFRNVWLNQGEIPTTLRPLLLDTDGDGLFTFRDLNDSRNASFVGDFNLNGRIDGGDLLRDTRWANGLDEAGNGYLDDLIGWDFVNNDNDPFDDNGHGTHVSGTIAAQGGNGIGVAGVAWSAQLVTLKFLDAAGSGSSTNAVKAIDYFTNARSSNPGLDFVATNNSWGGGGYAQAVADAIGRGAKADILFVAAAGNGGSDGLGDNNDGGYYPSGYNTASVAGYDAVVSVAALTAQGGLAGFSNYGAASVDLAAPGASILSTARGGGYGYMSGTSMATPHVAGAVAAFAASNPSYSAAQIRAELLGSTIATTSLSGKVATGGRLDVMEFVTVAAPAPPTIWGTTGSDTVNGTTASERIAGVAATGTNPGRGSVDMLYGRGGNDLFLFGDARGDFYVDASATGHGRGDYAQVRDWSAGDKVQLFGRPQDYLIKPGTYNGLSGLWVWQDTNLDGVAGANDEFIGHVVGPKAFNAADFIYLNNQPQTVAPAPVSTTSLWGTAGSETITGTFEGERIAGVAATGATPGRGSVDMLFGGGGNDLFLFGDARGDFYVDASATGHGRGDYAQVRDWSAGDKVQLFGRAQDYLIKPGTYNGLSGLWVWQDSDRDGLAGANDEFIGHVVGPNQYVPSDFVYLGNVSTAAALVSGAEMSGVADMPLTASARLLDSFSIG